MRKTGKFLLTWALVAAMSIPMTVGAAELPTSASEGQTEEGLSEVQGDSQMGSETIPDEESSKDDVQDGEQTTEDVKAPEETLPSEMPKEESEMPEEPAAAEEESETPEEPAAAEEESEAPEEPAAAEEESETPEEPAAAEEERPETPEEPAAAEEEKPEGTENPDVSQTMDGANEEEAGQENTENTEEPSRISDEIEEIEGLTLIEEKVITDDEILVQANRHGTISVNPLMYDRTYSNKTLIPLTFTLRSFGDTLDEYRITIYRGDSKSKGEPVARKVGTFSSEVGEKELTFEWNTEDVEKYKEGTYTIECIALYETKKVVDGKTTYVEHESSNEVFQVTLEDYKTVATRNFVRRLYTTALNRQAEKDGLQNWTDRLVKKEITGGEAVRGFILSREFANRNLSDSEYVDVLYQTLFDRASDAKGKNNWLDALNNGMSRTYVLKGFVDGAEFHALCNSYEINRGTIKVTENRDKNRGVTGFVWRFYEVALGRKPDIAGLNDWTGKLVDKKSSPEDVGRGFIFSAEVRNKNLSNSDFVKLLYQTFLNREYDEAGLSDWVGRLENGERRENVFRGFSRSKEFSDIKASFGL